MINEIVSEYCNLIEFSVDIIFNKQNFSISLYAGLFTFESANILILLLEEKKSRVYVQ